MSRIFSYLSLTNDLIKFSLKIENFLERKPLGLNSQRPISFSFEKFEEKIVTDMFLTIR